MRGSHEPRTAQTLGLTRLLLTPSRTSRLPTRYSIQYKPTSRRLYDISLTSVWATITINATIVLVAERPFTATYTILSPVYQDFEAQYLVDGAPVTGTIPVQRDFTAAYAITDELLVIEVYRDFVSLWTSAGVVYRDFACEYQVIADTSAPGWTEVDPVDETWTAVSAPLDTWTPVTNPTGSWA